LNARNKIDTDKNTFFFYYTKVKNGEEIALHGAREKEEKNSQMNNLIDSRKIAS
jgi:hypothetical protein